MLAPRGLSSPPLLSSYQLEAGRQRHLKTAPHPCSPARKQPPTTYSTTASPLLSPKTTPTAPLLRSPLGARDRRRQTQPRPPLRLSCGRGRRAIVQSAPPTLGSKPPPPPRARPPAGCAAPLGSAGCLLRGALSPRLSLLPIARLPAFNTEPFPNPPLPPTRCPLKDHPLVFSFCLVRGVVQVVFLVSSLLFFSLAPFLPPIKLPSL